MRAGRGRAAVWVVVGTGLLALAGCASGADIEIDNRADADVTVRLGDDEQTEVPDDGGTALLDVTECYASPAVITYADGRVVELDDDVCPGDLLRVTDDDVVLVRAADRVEAGA
ncbi:hypothetical protein [Cellulomonas sp. Y8]|uniref:hypothetical protein n=1 Tax=Cellulomonas sp. Y8 TaxID=2591145 RepID=UPI003D72E54F